MGELSPDCSSAPERKPQWLRWAARRSSVRLAGPEPDAKARTRRRAAWGWRLGSRTTTAVLP